MLTPLKQFICDDCGLVINSPKDGYVEWESGFDENDKFFARGFRIVHHSPSSSSSKRFGRRGCYKYEYSQYASDIDLEHYLKNAHQEMFSLLDIGEFHDPSGSFICGISDFREFVEFFRRLTIPYYEEARLYFSQALEDGIISTDMNVILLYSEDILKDIVEKYSQY